MKYTRLACFLATSFGCAHSESLSNAYSPFGRELKPITEQVHSVDPLPVSLGALLAAPEKYHHSRVRVEGQVVLEFEGNTLCPVQKPNDWQTCAWLDIEGLPDPGFRRARAVVEGTFDAENLGHLGIAGGTIGQITLMARLK